MKPTFFDNCIDSCPDCGGELEELDFDWHGNNDGDYLTPESYTIDAYNYRCRECGRELKLTKRI